MTTVSYMQDGTSDLSPYPHVDTSPLWYAVGMKTKKKVTRQVRISLSTYELVRRIAFRLHKPIGVVIDEVIASKKV
jgi:hypothetical protein